MTERSYNYINNLTGWVTFAIAAVTYLLTLEPSASFWDCPEYIAQSYALEVGHAPGNPFFALTARFFSNFASSPDKVAVCINAMSALLSAATVMLLFWTITHFARRLLCGVGKPVRTRRQMALIVGSGICGALAFTWSDTFWFSAVEAEVYAYSSFCTALTLWLVLKWENRINQPGSDRWLVAIAYVVGLSIGVHLLNLLCVPAIALVVYYRKVDRTHWWTTLPVLVLSLAIVMFILYGLVPGSLHLAQYAELLFVNRLGMSFNSGWLIYIATFAAIAVWAIIELHQQRNALRMKVSFLLLVAVSGVLMIAGENLYVPATMLVVAVVYFFFYCPTLPVRVMNNIALYIVAIMIGFSCYAIVPIRSNADTPMNVNRPNNPFDLESYISRDQFGSAPLFYGPVYTASSDLMQRDKNGRAITKIKKHRYKQKVKSNPSEPDSYIEISPVKETKYAPEIYMFLPRIYAPSCADEYSSWVGGITPTEIDAHVQHGDSVKTVKVQMPSYWDNIKYFAIYQFSQMYWRYMMFNFVGRQNDINGNGEVTQGNWLSGVPVVDNLRLGDQQLLPAEFGTDNEGHNLYYGIPLLLGLIGLAWQARGGHEGKRQAWVIFMLWFMTGIAIVLYLNQTPGQCRERDYSFVGSFYAYAIWIGLGVIGLARMLFKIYRRLFDNAHRRFERIATYIGLAAGIIVPLQMVSQTWDDHDRSNRYVARDFGQNYLSTVQEEGNPIIFTNGDNDTFPLWYNQETEGFRTDVRVCNLSYLQTDWYIDQMKRQAYDSPAVPIEWSRLEYVQGHNEGVAVRPEVMESINNFYKQNPEEAAKEFGDNPYELKNILKYWVRSPKEGLQLIPTDSIVIKLDKEAVKRSGMMIPDSLHGEIPDYMSISLKGKRMLYKSELMMLEMLANTNWERPLYMAITVGSDNHLNLGNNFMQEGLAYRITPFNTTRLNARIDSEKMYDNLMNKFKFGGINNPDIYIDETVMRMCQTHRRMFIQLATQLIKEGKKDKALKALDYCSEVIPSTTVPHDYIMSSSKEMADDYLALGEKEKGEAILNDLANKSVEYITWYLSLNDQRLQGSYEDCLRNFYILDEINKSLARANAAGGVQGEGEQQKKSDMASHYAKKFEDLYEVFNKRVGGGAGRK